MKRRIQRCLAFPVDLEAAAPSEPALTSAMLSRLGICLLRSVFEAGLRGNRWPPAYSHWERWAMLFALKHLYRER